MFALLHCAEPTSTESSFCRAFEKKQNVFILMFLYSFKVEWEARAHSARMRGNLLHFYYNTSPCIHSYRLRYRNTKLHLLKLGETFNFYPKISCFFCLFVYLTGFTDKKNFALCEWHVE